MKLRLLMGVRMRLQRRWGLRRRRRRLDLQRERPDRKLLLHEAP
jgi:hypothetical protein